MIKMKSVRIKRNETDQPNEIPRSFFLESKTAYDLAIKKHYEDVSKCNTNAEKISSINKDIAEWNDFKVKCGKDWFYNTPAIERLNSSCVPNDIVDRVIIFLKGQRELYKEQLDNETYDITPNSSKQKFDWNGQANILIDAFHQMKKSYDKEGKPLLPHSADEVAHFLKYGFDGFKCFENTKLDTIKTQLNRSDRPKKSEKRIKLKS
jgi:hypothetical protein